MKKQTPQKAAVLAGSVLLCLSAGLIGSVFTASSVGTWYATLAKPSFSPPSWLFGPVWTALYILMGVALYLVWLVGWKKRQVREAVYLFLVHLVFNTAWSWLFFGLQSPLAGLFGILVIWGFILILLVRFHRLRPAAAYLLVPYLAWVSFASVLNFSLWLLNP